MLYVVGIKVKFIYMGDEGCVIGLLSNGMFNVYVLDDDMVILVFLEDFIFFIEMLIVKFFLFFFSKFLVLLFSLKSVKDVFLVIIYLKEMFSY